MYIFLVIGLHNGMSCVLLENPLFCLLLRWQIEHLTQFPFSTWLLLRRRHSRTYINKSRSNQCAMPAQWFNLICQKHYNIKVVIFFLLFFTGGFKLAILITVLSELSWSKDLVFFTSSVSSLTPTKAWNCKLLSTWLLPSPLSNVQEHKRGTRRELLQKSRLAPLSITKH